MYAGYWHHDNASAQYMHNLQEDLRSHGAVDLVDQQVRERVLSQLSAPRNTTRELAELVSDDVTFPASTPRLAVVADDGRLKKAQIELGVAASPGPDPDCGWQVTDDGATIPLSGRAFEWRWWVRIGYLASADSPVTVAAGRTRSETSVQQGINSLYVRVDGTFTDVQLVGLDPGTVLCVDAVEVGQPIPGAPL